MMGVGAAASMVWHIGEGINGPDIKAGPCDVSDPVGIKRLRSKNAAREGSAL